MQWEERAGSARAFAPAVTEDGTLFVATASGVSALGSDGQTQWTLPLRRPLSAPAITPEGHIVFAAGRTELYTVDRAGRIRNRVPVGAVPQGSPLVLDDGSVVIAALDHAVHRFDAEGRRIFRTRVASTIRGEAALDQRGRLLVPTSTDLVTLDVDGRIVGTDNIARDTLGGPTVAEDGVTWLLGRRGGLVAVEADGRVAERADVATALSASNRLAVGSDGALRVTANSAGVVCVGPNGGERWRYEGDASFPGPLTLDANDTTLTTDGTGSLTAIGADGTLLWRVRAGSMSQPPVVGADGTVYVATGRGTIQAWR
jgi:outer membrane protein assembly factor BamB